MDGTLVKMVTETRADGYTSDYYGTANAVELSGSYLAVGVSEEVIRGAFFPGSVYLYAFDKTTGSTTLLERIIAHDATNMDNFGWSVALSGNGYLAVGANQNSDKGQYAGSVYFYSLDSTTGATTLVEKITAYDGGIDGMIELFGWSVALRGDGYLVVTSYAPGGVYLYSLDSTTGVTT
jgi:hypothetical protein